MPVQAQLALLHVPVNIIQASTHQIIVLSLALEMSKNHIRRRTGLTDDKIINDW